MKSKKDKVTEKVTPTAEEVYNENNPATDEEVFEEQIKAREEGLAAADNIDLVPEPEVKDLEDEDDEDYISDEEWDKMSPEERQKYESEDDEDDEDYISDEEWAKMTPEQKAEVEEDDDDITPEEAIDDDDPDYLMNAPEIVGFDDIRQQEELYDIATEEIDPDESVLDFGCGRGDLYQFLYKRNGENPNYKGVDINEPLINTGLEKYAPDIQIENRNWNELTEKDRADWCVNIGSLCARYDSSDKDNLSIITNTMDKMVSLCKQGATLILFSSYMPTEMKDEGYLIADTLAVIDHALKKYGHDTGNVVIDHSYSDSVYKITILKQQL